ncbi:S1 family peptidase, partial [Saccharopolyspora spinosporotrichia]
MIFAAGTIAALTVPATANPTAPAPVAAEAATLMEAMQRDLGLTAEQAAERLADEAAATRADQSLRGTLGSAFGGSHYDAALGKLVVGVTDAGLLDEVRAAGADGELVQHNVQQLDGVADGLDAQSARAPQSVTGWYVDSSSNSVVLTTAPGTAGQATDFVRA